MSSIAAEYDPDLDGPIAANSDPMPAHDDEPVDDGAAPETILHELMRLMSVRNIAEELTDEQLSKIGTEVDEGVQIDETSREEWKARTEAGMKLALQIAEPKSFPWPGAANLRYPLMTTASIQFAARAYPAIISDNQVVRAQVLGADPAGERKAVADRVSAHLSWQCLTEMEEWEPDVDKMLHNLPIVGCAFKKTYFSPELGRNCSPFIPAMDLIVNMNARSLATANRVTQVFSLYPYEIESRFRSGSFVRFEYQAPEDAPDDDDAPQDFWEQHRRLDLDDDGYLEPYIVTVHKETKEVVRIKANFDKDGIRVDRATGKVIGIDAIQYFTKIPFIPHPDGGFYDVGFAWLLTPINEGINTITNQILDAGTLANTGGGFIGNGLRLKGGTLRFQPGQYMEVDVPGGTAKENIVPLTFPGPSPVLFQMLGMLIDAGKEVASVKDVLTGGEPKGNTPATTTIAIIEQGLKVFTAIYKRIHRALKDEFAKMYRLNEIYLDPEMMQAFQYDGPPVQAGDYKGKPSDIIPVSDPTMVSDMQKMARAQFLQGFLGKGLNDNAILMRLFSAAGIENIPELMPPPKQGPSPGELAQFAELSAKLDKTHADAELARANALNYLAQAEKAGGEIDLAHLRLILDTLVEHSNAQQGQAQVQTPPDGIAPSPAAMPGIAPQPPQQAPQAAA